MAISRVEVITSLLMNDHDHLTALLGRLKLTALRDQLDSLINEAGRRELTIREALTLFAGARSRVATSAGSTSPSALPASPSCATSPASTSGSSRPSTRRRSARSRRAASSPVARQCSSWARRACARPSWRLRLARSHRHRLLGPVHAGDDAGRATGQTHNRLKDDRHGSQFLMTKMGRIRMSLDTCLFAGSDRGAERTAAMRP